MGIDTDAHTGTLAYGDANAVLDLDPDQPVLVNGRPCPAPPDTLTLAADDARGFVDALMHVSTTAALRDVW